MEGRGEEHRTRQTTAAHAPNQERATQENLVPEGPDHDDGDEAEEGISPLSSRRPTQELSRKISLPVLPTPTVDTSFSVDSILGAIKDDEGDDIPDFREGKKQEQRMSRVLKLREENDKLEAELKALRERIAAAEERSQTLVHPTKEGEERG